MNPRHLVLAIDRFWYPAGQCYVLNEGYALDTDSGWLWLIRWLAIDGTPSERSDLLPFDALQPIYEV